MHFYEYAYNLNDYGIDGHRMNINEKHDDEKVCRVFALSYIYIRLKMCQALDYAKCYALE